MLSPLKKSIGVFLFPALLGGVLATVRWLANVGVPQTAVMPIALVNVVVVMLVIERLVPLHHSWNQRPDPLDVLLLFGNRLIDVSVVAGVVGLLSLLHARGVRLQILSVWPVTWPLVAQAALGIVMAEGLRYLLHRLSHTPGLLGRVHATHHAPQRMYTLNGPRLHPLNQLWISVANTAPMLMLGAQLPAVMLAATVTAFFVLFQHANIGLSFSGWNWVFATSDVHRMHHSQKQVGKDVNYGIVLLAYDQLFGTYSRANVAIGPGDIGPSGEANAAGVQEATSSCSPLSEAP